MESGKGKRIIISGGGTGGHVFPAIAIANALKKIDPSTEILFVGALGRLEMEKVPAAGYKVIGLDIKGIQRGSIWKNLLLPFKLLSSIRKARKIIKEFKPDAAVGVGGYASGPLLYAASKKNVPYLIQEQNSFAGITNKRLGKRAKKICVAFDGMDEFFPKDKIVKTGNPVRRESVDIKGKREEAFKEFNLSPDKKTILVIGGSLGARTLNDCMITDLDKVIAADVQLIWQTGKYYYDDTNRLLGANYHPNVRIMAFMNRMDLGYAAADVIISRAGAGTIAELCIVGKPVILVPSPNVAEDHQTKNAMALVTKNAALLVKDAEAGKELVTAAVQLINDTNKQQELIKNISTLAFHNSANVIANEVLKLAGYKQ